MSIMNNVSLIVGLGNPGAQYSQNRHNAGALVLEAFAAHKNATWKDVSKLKSKITEISIAGKRVKLIFPTTFMNLSGFAVSAVASYYEINTSNVIVLHDEVDLSFGDVRAKFDGGTAGHNGLRSITQQLGKSSYHRIRIGVGRPQGREDIANFVLSNFTAEEDRIFNSTVIPTVITMIEQLVGS